MEVTYHPSARSELQQLRASDKGEYNALQVAIEKLRLFGDLLSYPHTSVVKGAAKLRELRPRGGRSRQRAFYRRIGDVIVVGAIGPEAETDPSGFRRAIRLAEERLDQVEKAGKLSNEADRAD
jgi:hypothetical protein